MSLIVNLLAGSGIQNIIPIKGTFKIIDDV